MLLGPKINSDLSRLTTWSDKTMSNVCFPSDISRSLLFSHYHNDVYSSISISVRVGEELNSLKGVQRKGLSSSRISYFGGKYIMRDFISGLPEFVDVSRRFLGKIVCQRSTNYYVDNLINFARKLLLKKYFLTEKLFSFYIFNLLYVYSYILVKKCKSLPARISLLNFSGPLWTCLGVLLIYIKKVFD